MKIYRIRWSLISIKTCPKYRITVFQNNLNFSLYATPSIYYLVTTSYNKTKFKIKNADKDKYIAINTILEQLSKNHGITTEFVTLEKS